MRREVSDPSPARLPSPGVPGVSPIHVIGSPSTATTTTGAPSRGVETIWLSVMLCTFVTRAECPSLVTGSGRRSDAEEPPDQSRVQGHAPEEEREGREEPQ